MLDPEANVADPGANAEQNVSSLHDVADLLPRHAALIDADRLRMVLGNDGLAQKRGGDWHAARLDKTAELLHQAIAVQLDATENHWAMPRRQQGHGLIEGLRERVGIGWRSGRRGVWAGLTAGAIHHVGRDFDHDGPLLGHAAGERAVDPLRSLCRIVKQHGRGRDMRIGLLHGREVADAVVQQH